MRIVIVEDEIRIREGLAKLIRRIDADFRIVGEAEDGLEGVRIIEETKPDLVITDVRMHDLNGLQMLALLKEKGVRSRVIVLSAYSEFAYAREAIKLGVSEYLLKPINVGDLARALKNIEDQMAAELASKNTDERPSLESVLYSILSGDGSTDASNEALVSENYRLDAAGRFALVSLHLGEKRRADGERIAGKVKATLGGRRSVDYCLLELPKAGKLALVLHGFRDEEAERRWFGSVFVNELRRGGLKDFGCAWIAFTRLAGLRAAMQELDACMEWSLVHGEGKLIICPDIFATQHAPLPYPITVENQVRSALCSGDRVRFQSGVGEFLRYLNSGKMYSPKEIKESVVRFFWAVLNAAREVAYDRYEAIPQQEILEMVTSAVTWSELESAVTNLMRLAPETAAEAAAKAGAETLDVGFVVNRTKNMVHEFYSQGITLEEIAAKINVTPEYLSAQFHRETGVNFSAFLKDFRMRKAKELLIGTELKLYAVAERVGYRDARYFCRVFKETTGQSPSDYRQTNR